MGSGSSQAPLQYLASVTDNQRMLRCPWRCGGRPIKMLPGLDFAAEWHPGSTFGYFAAQKLVRPHGIPRSTLRPLRRIRSSWPFVHQKEAKKVPPSTEQGCTTLRDHERTSANSDRPPTGPSGESTSAQELTGYDLTLSAHRIGNPWREGLSMKAGTIASWGVSKVVRGCLGPPGEVCQSGPQSRKGHGRSVGSRRRTPAPGRAVEGGLCFYEAQSGGLLV